MLFGDRTTRLTGIERRVRVKPLGACLFECSEQISVGDVAKRRQCSDNLRILARPRLVRVMLAIPARGMTGGVCRLTPPCK